MLKLRPISWRGNVKKVGRSRQDGWPSPGTLKNIEFLLLAAGSILVQKRLIGYDQLKQPQKIVIERKSALQDGGLPTLIVIEKAREILTSNTPRLVSRQEKDTENCILKKSESRQAILKGADALAGVDFPEEFLLI